MEFPEFNVFGVLSVRVLFTCFGTPGDGVFSQLQTDGFGFATRSMSDDQNSGVTELLHCGGYDGFVVGVSGGYEGLASFGGSGFKVECFFHWVVGVVVGATELLGGVAVGGTVAGGWVDLLLLVGAYCSWVSVGACGGAAGSCLGCDWWCSR